MSDTKEMTTEPKSLDDFYCDDKIGKAQKNLFHVQFSLHFQSRLETKSLYVSRAVIYFYETEFELWAHWAVSISLVLLKFSTFEVFF